MATISLETFTKRFPLLRAAAGALFILMLPAFTWLVMGPLSTRFDSFRNRTIGFVLLAVAGTVLVRTALPRLSWTAAGFASILVQGFVYRLALFIPEISTYPLSLGWSEASRYYYASIFFSRGIYGIWTPPSVLHPSRYLMQAVPFLVPGLPILFHRIWQVLLWIGFTSLTAYALVKRLKLQDKFNAFLLGTWAFLFLFQGPVYYHLLVMVIAVLWFFDAQRFRRSLVVVLLASAWAGISRINWLPVPGMLAAALYFLEVEVRGRKLIDYLLHPALYTLVGAAAGFLVQKAYETFSGNPAYVFGSSFSSDLLWYRLMPSSTYEYGILRAAAVAALPALALLVYTLWKMRRKVHPIRWAGIAAILAVLLAGGLVVSVKIGGGSNLHNLDAFLALLLVSTAAAALGRIRAEEAGAGVPSRSPVLLLTLAVIVPVGFLFQYGGALHPPDQEEAGISLARLKEIVEPAAARGERILFIAERHLITFGELDVELEPDYERVFLMEMAMANNKAYLERFHNDLRSHRFDMIVLEKQHNIYQGRTVAFGEENDAWVSRVSEPLMCSYSIGYEIPEVNLVVYVPGGDEQYCR